MTRIRTDHPIAVDSVDHLHPRGTMRDNSVNLNFNLKLFALGEPVSVLDLGCAGGGMVESIHNDGGRAVGIDGSDYSRRAQRAAWATIPERLFTADITKPFTLHGHSGLHLKFTAITAWEFFEHIPEGRLSGVFDNINRHLAKGGLVIVSIATIPDEEDGHSWHPTVRSQEWWLDLFESHGLRLDAHLTDYFEPDWVRGPLTGNTSSLCGVFRRYAKVDN